MPTVDILCRKIDFSFACRLLPGAKPHRSGWQLSWRFSWCLSITLALSGLNAIVGAAVFAGSDATANLPRSISGSAWTRVKPDRDSRIIYVSSSLGNDATGRVYRAGQIEDLVNPGEIRAFASISIALAKMRKGQPDILLLRRGDSWNVDDSIWLRSGRSPTARSVIASYGSSRQRPLLTGDTTIIKIWQGRRNIAVIGLSLYASRRDPNSAEFAGWQNVSSSSGIRVFGVEGERMDSILIEDNRINFFSRGITINGNASFEDIVIRRNIISNSYDTKIHSQGIYANNTSMLLEENIFDHNGWFQQRRGGGNNKKEGQATIFNHNTYLTNSKRSIFRKNLFLRSSSLQNKWTSNSKHGIDRIQAEEIVIENNFYHGGEVGIGIGGNTDNNNGYRWRNIQVLDNVMVGIGKNRPTNRSLGWYLVIRDWNGGRVCGNYFLNNGNPKVQNLAGIKVLGHISDLSIEHNVIQGLITDTAKFAAIQIDGSGPKSGMKFLRNRIQLQRSRMAVFSIAQEGGLMLQNNRYFTDAPPNQWFKFKQKPFSFRAWTQLMADKSTLHEPVPNKNLDLDSYAEFLGLASSAEFIRQATTQSRFNWNEDYGAEAINRFFKIAHGGGRCPSEVH